MTRKEMEDQIVQWLGLQDITDLNERTLVQEQIYLGVLDLLSRTRCVVRCIQIRTLANVSQYTLDHSVLALVDVEDGSLLRRRRDDSRRGFALIRSDILRVQPTPSEDGELQVWAVKRPQRMTDDDHSPSFEEFGAIPDEFQDAIVLYVMWHMADYSDDSTQQGERYRILYEGQDSRGGRIAEIKRMVNRRGTSRLPRSRVSLAPVSASSRWTG